MPFLQSYPDMRVGSGTCPDRVLTGLTGQAPKVRPGPKNEVQGGGVGGWPGGVFLGLIRGFRGNPENGGIGPWVGPKSRVAGRVGEGGFLGTFGAYPGIPGYTPQK